MIALLDAASFLRDVPDSHPDIVALEAAGCFRDGAFDPGPEGARLIRDWRISDESTGGPQELLSALAAAVTRTTTVSTSAGMAATMAAFPRFGREIRRGTGVR